MVLMKASRTDSKDDLIGYGSEACSLASASASENHFFMYEALSDVVQLGFLR